MSQVRQLYLSPHFDDAILSCGGLIHRQRSAGESVAVMTFCAGSPDYNYLSPLAQQYHTAWGNPHDPIALRRAEDGSVLNALGVSPHYGNTLEIIYRRIGNEFIYSNRKALFTDPHSQELDSLPRLWRQDVESLGFNPNHTIIYAPLAIGNHVDHQLARVLALQLIKAGWQVWFYEDYPYVELSAEGLAVAKAWFGPIIWQFEIIPIDVNAKIAAIRGYETQIPRIFGSEQSMKFRVKQFTAETACSINLWERARYRLVGCGGWRARLWRAVFGYHCHAERIWMWV